MFNYRNSMFNLFFQISHFSDWYPENSLSTFKACDSSSRMGSIRMFKDDRSYSSFSEETITSFSGKNNWNFYDEDNGIFFIFAGTFCAKIDTYTFKITGN